MKTKIPVLLFLFIVLIGSCVPAHKPCKGDQMTIDLESTSEQYISFPGFSIEDYTQYSILSWAYIESFGTQYAPNYYSAPLIGFQDVAPGDFLGEFGIYDTVDRARHLYFSRKWSGSFGAWQSPAGGLTAGNSYFFAVTYNGSSASNDAILYINGQPVTVTEYLAPSGTLLTGTNSITYVGANGLTLAAPSYYDGLLYSILVFNRILSASEILEAYNSRLAIPNLNGLVFAPDLRGAAGLVYPDGSTLAAGNTIVDLVSGTRGIPAGSPILRADSLLTYEGID